MPGANLSPLHGRRIHISGSVHRLADYANSVSVREAQEFIRDLVTELLKEGATFVVPIDKEPEHEDGRPVCFDWLVLETIYKNLNIRPRNTPLPLIVGVQHFKNESQIPDARLELWNNLQEVDGLVAIENAGHWKMNSRRMDLQALHGDILITLGGDEGVLYLANVYHDAGKPVIPLNLQITAEGKGSLRLHNMALASPVTEKFFQTVGEASPHDLLNRINFTSKTPLHKKVNNMLQLLRSLRKPIAFGVRLLNPAIENYQAVEDYFSGVIRPVVEDELGYELVVLDGKKNDQPFINQEIFDKLHRSSVAIVDFTGERSNCFIELGYALARGIPVMVTALEGTTPPFDTQPVPTRSWNTGESLENRKELFRQYWRANIQRRKVVADDPLIY